MNQRHGPFEATGTGHLKSMFGFRNEAAVKAARARVDREAAVAERHVNPHVNRPGRGSGGVTRGGHWRAGRKSA